MARDRRRPALLNWSEYLIARLAALGTGILDIDTTLRAAGKVGQWYYHIGARHRERALVNLRRAFPERSEAQLQTIARDSFSHFFRLVIEGINSPRLIHRDSWADRVHIDEVGEIIALLNSDKPVLLITGHMGNWEALGSMLAVIGYPIEAVARPIDNPLINNWLLGARERRGLRIIAKWDREVDRMLDVLQSGGTLGIVGDQNAIRGLFVPFFGRLASTHKSIGLLAIQHEAPVVCGFARRLGVGCRFQCHVQDIIYPDDWADQPDPLYYVTARIVRALEMLVRRFPEQYLWMHRRWKKRPKHELEGKPMPAKMRQKLEALPWMDEATMQRLLNPPHLALQELAIDDRRYVESRGLTGRFKPEE